MVNITWFGPAVIMIAISTAYFLMDSRERNRGVRLLVSAHGLIAALLYIGALTLWEITNGYRPWAAWPFLFFHLIPLASIVYAFVRFKGPKLLHITQVVNVSCMVYTLFVGGMAVTGDWL